MSYVKHTFARGFEQVCEQIYEADRLSKRKNMSWWVWLPASACASGQSRLQVIFVVVFSFIRASPPSGACGSHTNTLFFDYKREASLRVEMNTPLSYQEHTGNDDTRNSPPIQSYVHQERERMLPVRRQRCRPLVKCHSPALKQGRGPLLVGGSSAYLPIQEHIITLFPSRPYCTAPSI